MTKSPLTQITKIRRTRSDKITDFVVYTILILLCVVMVLPFMQVITISMSPPEEVNRYGFHFFPNLSKLDFTGYQQVFKYDLIWSGYFNTLVRVLIGSSLSVILSILGAYPLSKKYLPNRGFWTGFVVFTMYFSGGLIPNYILIKDLNLMNNMWALILPGAINTFNMIVMRNFFMSLPDSLEESARIDGANELVVLVRIVLPVSLPIVATVSLWYVVADWNSWFDCMIYIMDSTKYTLQYVLRQIILEGKVQDLSEETIRVTTETMKMAALVVSTLPIVCVYPFIQKYFVKGVMVGSLKG